MKRLMGCLLGGQNARDGLDAYVRIQLGWQEVHVAETNDPVEKLLAAICLLKPTKFRASDAKQNRGNGGPP